MPELFFYVLAVLGGGLFAVGVLLACLVLLNDVVVYFGIGEKEADEKWDGRP